MSSEEKTITANKLRGEEYKVPCTTCFVETRHKVLQSVDISISVDDRNFMYWEEDSFQTIQCQGCDGISFRRLQTNSEDIDHDPEMGEQSSEETVNVYPSRVAGRHRLRQADELPFQISRIYKETHAALCTKQPILAGIGIRTLVEAICQQEQATGTNLEKKIDSLVALDVLTKRGAETLHGTRLLGNAAAHEVEPHSENILSLAMDVVEHLLTDVYILPNATEKLPKRKKSV